MEIVFDSNIGDCFLVRQNYKNRRGKAQNERQTARELGRATPTQNREGTWQGHSEGQNTEKIGQGHYVT